MVLQEEYQQLEMLAKSKERNLRDESGHALASPRSSSTAVGGKSTSCPLCPRKTWAQQEQDLWRLERWLEHAENQFRTHERIPTNMEPLEDTVQDFRELSLDLDSHKNIVMSLNIVVNHVAEHAVTADQRAADRLRIRLAAANSRWDAVCKSAARIQARLQSSLMQNEEYHRTIRDLVTWLERTETDIQGAEPIDLTVGTKQLKAQLTKFQDLYAQLSQFEPRVTSMREIADQVFAQSVEADSAQLRSKLAVLNDRLTSLLKICAQYKQLLDGALRNQGASVSPSTPSGLNLSGMSSPGCKSLRPSIVVHMSKPDARPGPASWASPVMQIPLPVPFPLACGSLARERSPLLELLGGLLVKPPSERHVEYNGVTYITKSGVISESSPRGRASSMDERTFASTVHSKYGTILLF
ncbi:hypothetical protein DAPPUDRAFT_238990 [Daphnia pulex]|uniref:Uncharacterized protein n=1 Tax=Daphnia pulex TaxID=6669 RepID=E9G7Y3_DAPPU|nr:hypothetical protein DAPPUDRAFT_238990 [Daphnia pulex]|eukprot:EFX84561.1 hypothetical protein DAPPUDRAFT_238990 [Daphnia pulex]